MSVIRASHLKVTGWKPAGVRGDGKVWLLAGIRHLSVEKGQHLLVTTQRGSWAPPDTPSDTHRCLYRQCLGVVLGHRGPPHLGHAPSPSHHVSTRPACCPPHTGLNETWALHWARVPPRSFGNGTKGCEEGGSSLSRSVAEPKPLQRMC